MTGARRLGFRLFPGLVLVDQQHLQLVANLDDAVAAALGDHPLADRVHKRAAWSRAQAAVELILGPADFAHLDQALYGANNNGRAGGAPPQIELQPSAVQDYTANMADALIDELVRRVMEGR